MQRAIKVTSLSLKSVQITNLTDPEKLLKMHIDKLFCSFNRELKTLFTGFPTLILLRAMHQFTNPQLK